MADSRSLLGSIAHEYEEWVVKNAKVVGQIESSLNGLLLLLPASGSSTQDKRSGALPIVEIGYTVVGLFSWINDLVFMKKMQQHALNNEVKDELFAAPYFPTPKLPPPSALSITKWLSLIRHIELPAEMFAMTRDSMSVDPSKQKTWKAVVFAIELVKALLKVVLYFRLVAAKQGTILSYQALPERNEFWDENFPGQRPMTDSNTPNATAKSRPILLNSTQKVRKSPRTATKFQMLGEILWIARPLIFLGLIFKHGQKSWIPWLLSFIVDIASHLFSSNSQPKALLSSTSLKQSIDEDRELDRRTKLWFLYAMRSPFFEAFKDGAVGQRLVSLPLLGGILAFILRLLDSYRQFYFYISGT